MTKLFSDSVPESVNKFSNLKHDSINLDKAAIAGNSTSTHPIKGLFFSKTISKL